MLLLIDGYNLLHASGIIGRGVGPGDLERSRRALLNVLASSLEEETARRTVIVFDAADPPPGLPRSEDFRGLKVRYASAYDEADTLIEELIRRASAPRRLTVVSSDHRIQRAARKRRATAVDSDRWYAELLQRRGQKASGRPNESAKPTVMTEGEVKAWLEEFGASDDLAEPIANELHEVELGTESPDDDESRPANDPNQPEDVKELPDVYNPFPPGYGEDLLDDI
jgi:hypothetical protein